MRLQISINLDNAAFQPSRQPSTDEIQRILHDVADRLTDKLPTDGLDRMIHDTNGNTVGSWGIYQD